MYIATESCEFSNTHIDTDKILPFIRNDMLDVIKPLSGSWHSNPVPDPYEKDKLRMEYIWTRDYVR